MKNSVRKNDVSLIVLVGLLIAMCLTSVGYAQTASLTSAEASWLTYLREEEKVARDVYLYLFDVWGSPIFTNISASEERHMDSIRMLLDKYRIADPAAGKAEGEFTNPELQALYDDLVAQGSLSLVSALEVGVLIEQTDIADLKAAMASTNRKDIKNVYTSLLRGSNNHLKAFDATLANQ